MDWEAVRSSCTVLCCGSLRFPLWPHPACPLHAPPVPPPQSTPTGDPALVVVSRGNLGEMEWALGVSYSMVRSKRGQLVQALEEAGGNGGGRRRSTTLTPHARGPGPAA